MIKLTLGTADATLIELALADRAAELERDAEKYGQAAFAESAKTYRRLEALIVDAPEVDR